MPTPTSPAMPMATTVASEDAPMLTKLLVIRMAESASSNRSYILTASALCLSPSSAARGHYYQGKLGRRLWQRLTTIGLLTGASPGLEDDAFVALGHGLTDLVKRVTPGLSGLTDNELREGASALEARVRQWRPGVVVFVFKEVAVRALGRADLQPGPCGEFAGATAFLLPGPYAKKSAADRVYASLRELQRG